MPEKSISFINAQAPGYDELGGAAPVAMNVVTEATGAVRRRPGLMLLPDAPSVPLADGPVTGIHYTQNGKLIAVVDDGAERPIFRIAGGSALLLGGGAPPNGLRGTGRPIFAETPMLLVIAGGDEMQKIILSTLASSRLGGGPPKASHVVALTQRLVTNDLVLDPGTIRYSDIASGTITYAGHEVWSAGVGDAGAVTAEGRPDPVISLTDNTNELFALGTSSVQIFLPDTELVFGTTSARDIGQGARYSAVKSDHQVFWLDDHKRFTLGDGRSYDVVSDSIKRILDEMDDVSDCFGYRMVLGPMDAVLWTFPSDGRTFVFQKGVGWGQWSGWNGNWTQFPVTSHHLRSGDGANIVGLADGRVAQLSFAASTDLGDPINSNVTTGYENRGTDHLKHCAAVRLALRRGETQTSSSPHAWLRYRDRPGPWAASIPVRLGRTGDTEVVVNLRSLGTYRRRQWQFEFIGAEGLVLLSATEEFTILDG